MTRQPVPGPTLRKQIYLHVAGVKSARGVAPERYEIINGRHYRPASHNTGAVNLPFRSQSDVDSDATPTPIGYRHAHGRLVAIV